MSQRSRFSIHLLFSVEMQNQRLLTTTGIVSRYWISNEYGPYIYHYDANGTMIQTIQPPAAFLPFTADGVLNFTSLVDPATGRGGNKGACYTTTTTTTLYLDYY